MYLLYASDTQQRPTGRISCELSCVLTSLTLTRGDTMRGTTAEFPITKLVGAHEAFSGRTQHQRAEWNRKSLFQYRFGLQDRAESIKIRKNTVYGIDV